jgi:cytochrome c556
VKKTLKTSLLALAAMLVAGSVAAQQLKPEEMIQIRQAGYKTMGWNMGKIKGQVEGAADKFDKTLTANAANTIKAVANSGMGALYGPGTDKAVGDVKTRVKPEFFDPANKDEIGKIAGAFVREANKLAEVAAGGDQKAIQAQFGEMGKACKGCHDKFRIDEKK